VRGAFARRKAGLKALMRVGRASAPPPNQGASALAHFVRHQAVPWESSGGEISRRLLAYAAAGAASLVVCAVVFALLPDPDATHGSGLLLIGENVGSVLLAVSSALIIPLAVCGTVLLVVDGVLWAGGGVRAPGWHYMVATQPFVGGVGLSVSFLLAVLVVINIIIWVAFISLMVAVGLALLAALLSG